MKRLWCSGRWPGVPLTIVVGLAVLVSCGSGPAEGDLSAAPALEAVLASAARGQWRATGTDTFEVWVCDVPADSTASIYGGLPLRRRFDPARLARLLSTRVPTYFRAVSGGKYEPEFLAGGTVRLGRNEEPTACVDRAIAGAGSGTRAVLVVATAEHAPGHPGGTASPGNDTPGPAPVAVTRRYVSVGAADFAPEWGDDPPVDLVEHEIGHSLGWSHSGIGADGSYLSPVDVMSNSAAPRGVNEARRDGPVPLALHRLMAGWLPRTAVVTTNRPLQRVLAASTDVDGVRVLVVTVDERHFITVERLVTTGFNDHLPHEGLSVHAVTVQQATVNQVTVNQVTEPSGSTSGSRATIDTINPLHGLSDGWSLIQRGDAFLGMGWKVAFLLDGSVRVTRT